jgi:hypothetical protein
MTDVLGILMLAAIPAFIVGRYIREENRRNAAWLEHMRELSNRCPVCRGDGLDFLTPFGQDPTCRLCGGTGSAPGGQAALSPVSPTDAAGQRSATALPSKEQG